MKGQSSFIIISTLVAIVSLVIVSLVYNQFSDSVGIDEVNEKLCKQKIDTLSGEAREGITENVLNLLSISPLEFSKNCPTQKIIIDPNKLDCDQNIINLNPYDSTKNCIADEILDYSRRCWDMNGEGLLNGYNWACYTISIGSVDKVDKNKFIRNKLKAYFSCDDELSNSNCRTLEQESFINAQYSTIYSSFIKDKETRDVYFLASCLNIGSEFNSQIMVEQTEESIITNYELVTEYYNEIYENNLNNLNNINSSKEGCSNNDIRNSLYQNKEDYERVKNKLKQQNDIIYNNYCSSKNVDICNSDNPKYFELEFLLDQSLSSDISIKDLEYVANYKMYNKYLTFAEKFRLSESDKKLSLYNDEVLSETSAFQINYCDGLSSISGGLIPMYMCGTTKHISISNNLDNAGSRLALENAGGSCPILSTLSSAEDLIGADDFVFGTLSEVCENFDIGAV